MDVKKLQIISETYPDILERLCTCGLRFRPAIYGVFLYTRTRSNHTTNIFFLVNEMSTRSTMLQFINNRPVKIEL
jgi:hypothetical protein